MYLHTAGALAGCANEGVAVVKYTYESASLNKLLQLVSAKLRGHPALSIALIVDGNQNTLKICSQKVLVLNLCLKIVISACVPRFAMLYCILVTGQNCIRCGLLQMLNETSLREDSEMRDFLKQLTGNYLHSESRYARLDLLLCPLASTPAGDQLLAKLKGLVKIPVFMSADILGPCISEAEG